MTDSHEAGFALACVARALGSAPRVLKKLSGGPASYSWLVMHAGVRAVLRHDRALAGDLGLDRTEEVRVVRGVAAAGIAPPVLFADPQHGIAMTRFVEGRSWTDEDFRDQEQLFRLGDLLGDLHRLAMPARTFDLRAILRAYQRQLGSAGAATLVAQAETLLDGAGDRTPVLCHNDVTEANVIDDGRLWLIDWEYSGLGNPFFDLAVIVRHHDLDAQSQQALLSAWPDGDEEGAATELQRFCHVYDRVLILWSALVERREPLSNAARLRRECAVARTGHRMAMVEKI